MKCIKCMELLTVVILPILVVSKELLHGKYGARCLWQRFCDQIGEGGEAARSTAARGERKVYEDRITG